MATVRSNNLEKRQTSRSSNENKRRLSKRACRRKTGIKASQTYWAVKQESVNSPIDKQQRLELLRRYGDFTLAYSTVVQPRLMYFVDDGEGSDNPQGFIAYRSRWGLTFALGDPVVSDENRRGTLEKFNAQLRRPTYCQISEPTAVTLDSLGYFVNEMGVDTVLDLDQYNFNGKEKEWLRYAANWTAKRGYLIRECDFRDLDVDAIEAISEAWRKTRTIKKKEVRFLNRPIVLNNETDVRKFFLFSPDQRILAFVFLDPLYRDGKVFGYVTAIKRRHPDAPLYAEHAIMKYAIEKLKQEGVEQIRLGLSPGAGIEDDRFRAIRLTNWMYRFGYKSKIVNNHIYHLQGHAQYKRRFRGREEKTYMAFPTRFNFLRQMALIGICGIA